MPELRRSTTHFEVAAVVLPVVLGLLLRLPHLLRGWSSDEVGWIGSGALDPLHSPESLVNPPLLRYVLVACFGDLGALWAGRSLSLVCGTAAIAVGYVVGRHLAGPWAGTIVSMLVALHPDATEHSALFRAYSPWLFAGMIHVLAVLWLVEGRRGASAAVALTAILLPGLHFLSVPILAAETVAAAWGAMGPRRHALLFAPAWLFLVSAALPALFGVNGAFEPGSAHYVLPVVIRCLSAGVSGMLVVLVPTILAAGVRGWRPSPASGLLLVVSSAYAVSCTLLTTTVDVRPPATILLLPYLLPVFAGALVYLRTQWPLAFWVSGALSVIAMGNAAARTGMTIHGRDGVQAFAASRDRFPELWSGGPIVVTPSYELTVLAVEVAGRPLQDIEVSCDPSVPAAWLDRISLGCLHHDGAVFLGADEPLEGATVVLFGAPDAAFAKACRTTGIGRGFAVATCDPERR